MNVGSQNTPVTTSTNKMETPPSYNLIYYIYYFFNIHKNTQILSNFLICPLTFPFGLSSVDIFTYASPFSIFSTNSSVFFPCNGPLRSCELKSPSHNLPVTSSVGVSDLNSSATVSPFSCLPTSILTSFILLISVILTENFRSSLSLD